MGLAQVGKECLRIGMSELILCASAMACLRGTGVKDKYESAVFVSDLVTSIAAYQ